ncbi:MAG: hydroxyethylthiazole kinase [Longicatena sp.]
MFEREMENVVTKAPLVHCITNYVTVNDCANAVLAVHGSPIMADDEAEVEEITSICNALVINIGTLNKRTIASMIKAGKKANEVGHPVILDPVGAGASTLRTQTTFDLLKEVKFSIIRGNISEIKTVYAGSGSTKGVDADVSDVVTKENLDETLAFAKELSKKTGAVIAITGAIDIICNTDKAYVIFNGHKEMSRITGTGCMLSAILGAYAGANPENLLDACACGVAHMGYSGELAQERVLQEKKGSGSLHIYIIDALSNMTPSLLNGGLKIEVR